MKSRSLKNVGLSLTLGGAMLAGVVGCETKAGTGALVGAGIGGAGGGLIGSKSHARAGEGVAIGAGVGALAGFLVGNEMDKSDTRDRDAARADYQQRDRDRYDSRRGNSYEYGSSDGGSGEYRYPAETSRLADKQANSLTKDDIIRWTNGGTRDDIIIDRIERSGVVFRLTAADENLLRDNNVSESVIRAMRDTARH